MTSSNKIVFVKDSMNLLLIPINKLPGMKSINSVLITTDMIKF
jgi:hypothetical protein